MLKPISSLANHPPFSIGLQPFDLGDWLDVDENHAVQMAQRAEIYADAPSDVFRAAADTENAQTEVLSLITEHLLARHDAVADRHGAVQQLGTWTLPEHAGNTSPLLTAGLLVQEDLVLMVPSSEGWRIGAAFVAFPSSWSLREKFGRPLHDVHKPVPGFGTGSRNAGLIDRIFDNLQPEIPVERQNWSLTDKSALPDPATEGHHNQQARTFDTSNSFLNGYVRLERQTLRKLPLSASILFTIRIYVDPVRKLKDEPDAKQVIEGLNRRIETMSDEELEYKGLHGKRKLIQEGLRDLLANTVG